jgi:hypothetical protein
VSLSYTPVTSTDATASSGVAASTTSFSPAAGSMVAVLVAYQFSSSGEVGTLTCKDSNGVSYTAGPQIQNSYDSYISAIFTCQYASAPGSITVSITSTNTSTAYALITPLVFTGQAGSQSGAGTATADPSGSISAISTSITTTTAGSYVVGVGSCSNGSTLTPLANTTTLATWTAADSGGTCATTSTTVTPGATTVGWTCSPNSTYGDAIALLEILPSGGGGGSVQPNGIPAPSGDTWAIIFDDEFPGTSLNTSNWTVASGNTWSASGMYSYASNIYMQDPGLALEAASSSSGVQIQTNYFLSVGDCCEAKIWFPGPPIGTPGQQIYNWPAWWMAGEDWPANGEIDIAEGLGDGSSGTLTINYHDSSGNYNGPNPGPSGNWSNSWHTYGVIRNSTSFTAYYDGVAVYTHATGDEGGDMALLLDISSGEYGGEPLYGTSSQMQVEYVRAWTAVPGGTPIAAGLASGTGAALAPAAGVTPSLASGTGAALPPAANGALPSLAHGAGTAFAPGIGVLAGLATGQGAALQGFVLLPPRAPENLGATFTYAALGGTAATVANTYGGTLTLPNYGGGLTGWTMQQINLTLAENNDETVAVAITSGGSPLSLSGATINMYLKTAAGAPDGAALVLSSAGGTPAITITNSAGGLCSVAIPRANLYPETYTFYRIDVVFSGLQNTCIYGNVTWITL